MQIDARPEPRAAARPDPRERDHRRLAAFNRDRLAPGLPGALEAHDPARAAAPLALERRLLAAARRTVAARAAAAPRDPAGFVAWFAALRETGPGQGDALFPWLAERAGAGEMRWFLQQEVAGEAGFDDLLALTQLKMPERPKLEMARNYWDEMGRGNPKGLHGGMLATLADALDLTADQDAVVWEALALGNLMIAMAANRDHAFHAVGALGAIELTAPTRAVLVARGLKRLGVPTAQRHYFDLHAVLDVAHADAWIDEVLRPLVATRPETAPAIAEGALIRLSCGEACFRRYRAHLGLAQGAARQ